jgi:hypothetical protein
VDRPTFLTFALLLPLVLPKYSADRSPIFSVKKQVKAKPNSKKQQLVTEADGSLTAYLKSAPMDGKANQELIQLLAESFKVAKSQVAIKSGLSSRIKIVEIQADESEHS